MRLVVQKKQPEEVAASGPAEETPPEESASGSASGPSAERFKQQYNNQDDLGFNTLESKIHNLRARFKNKK